jgi:hypothetical protein
MTEREDILSLAETFIQQTDAIEHDEANGRDPGQKYEFRASTRVKLTLALLRSRAAQPSEFPESWPPAAEAQAAITDEYDRGRREVLNSILALNPPIAAKLAELHERLADPHGKLPFDVVFWVCEVAAQLGIEPKDQPE